MCVHLHISQSASEIENRFMSKFSNVYFKDYEPIYHINAYTHGKYPVITLEKPNHIQPAEWGLVPTWTKDISGAKQIRKSTVNARCETIFDKPSYKNSIKTGRCLIPASGFFEWNTEENNKTPYFISMTDKSIFAMAGLVSLWNSNNESTLTFSIITTKANSLLSKIHNSKKRMPVILSPKNERQWLRPELSQSEIKSLLQPADDGILSAWPVSKPLLLSGDNSISVTKKTVKFTQQNLF